MGCYPGLMVQYFTQSAGRMPGGFFVCNPVVFLRRHRNIAGDRLKICPGDIDHGTPGSGLPLILSGLVLGRDGSAKLLRQEGLRSGHDYVRTGCKCHIGKQGFV